jgi:hypothetical protein
MKSENMKYPTLAHFRHFSSLLTNLRSTTVENIRQITPFYAKQSQFYAFFARKRRFHKKTNPIQTQFKPNKAKNKPNLSQFLSQFKPNSNPILSSVAYGEGGSKPISNGRTAWLYPACASKRLTESCNGEKAKRNVFSSFYFLPEDVKLRQLLSAFRTFYRFNGIYGYFLRMSKRKLKTAVLGLDGRGELLLEALKGVDYFEIQAVADKDTSLAEKIASQYQCAAYDDYRQLIIQNQLDCLLVAAGIHSCDEYVRMAMKKKFNIFKLAPAARDFEEAVEFVRLSEEQDIKFAVGNLKRFGMSLIPVGRPIRNWPAEGCCCIIVTG